MWGKVLEHSSNEIVKAESFSFLRLYSMGKIQLSFRVCQRAEAVERLPAPRPQTPPLRVESRALVLSIGQPVYASL